MPFYGYDQPKDRHERWPWWVRVSATSYRRADGWKAEVEAKGSAAERVRLLNAEIVNVDAANPLAAPEPRCGQVWAQSETDSVLISSVEALRDGRYRVGVGIILEIVSRDPAIDDDRPTWPPRGFVLVAGPGAPWAPTGAGR